MNSPFPPRPTPRTRALTREHNCGRIEIRWVDCLEVRPSQVGLPGARLVARMERRVRRKRTWSRETVYLISSRSLDELQAQGVLWLKRKYWVIESRLHHCLDITLQEDLSRVRSPNAVQVLGMIRRLVVSLSNAAVDRSRAKNPKTKHNLKSFQKRLLSAHGGRQRLQAMIFAKHPQLRDL